MTEDELRTIFKPDKYGFCVVKLQEGGVAAVWFDTVLKVHQVLEENK
jgi:hypothetical protein